MNLLIKSLLMACGLFSAMSATAQTPTHSDADLKLENIIIFSRHGLRTPIEKNAGEMAQFSPYTWATFDVPSGHLTDKGVILETYFGQYIGQWLRAQGLLTDKMCADGTGLFAYANNVQRTIATGQAILAGGFADCKVSLNYQSDMSKPDPLFRFVLRTDKKAFIQRASKRLNISAANKRLAPSYQLLNQVLDYRHSERCLKQGKCDLGADKGKFVLEQGKTPKISGSLSRGKKLVNALLLARYIGKPDQEIANGHVDSWEKWVQLNRIRNEYARILYRDQPELAANVALPMLRWMEETFPLVKWTAHKPELTPTIHLLVGHDTNIVALLGALEVPIEDLPEQLEVIPIGGKLFFEVWRNTRTGERKLKLEYVYQTDQQIREAQPLSLANPPKHVPLRLANCRTDAQGFCPYKDFQSILPYTIQRAGSE